MYKKTITGLLLISSLGLLGGCAAALVGGGAAGGYVVAKDKGTVGTYTDDSVITSRVKAKLLTEKDVRSLGVSVSTNQGVVSLTGNAPNYHVRGKIINAARSVPGVRGVNAHNLTVGR